MHWAPHATSLRRGLLPGLPGAHCRPPDRRARRRPRLERLEDPRGYRAYLRRDGDRPALARAPARDGVAVDTRTCPPASKPHENPKPQREHDMKGVAVDPTSRRVTLIEQEVPRLT